MFGSGKVQTWNTNEEKDKPLESAYVTNPENITEKSKCWFSKWNMLVCQRIRFEDANVSQIKRLIVIIYTNEAVKSVLLTKSRAWNQQKWDEVTLHDNANYLLLFFYTILYFML